MHFKQLYRKLLGAILAGNGQAWLLIAILALLTVIRFTFQFGIPLNELGYVSAQVDSEGIVVYSNGDRKLLLDDSVLRWMDGEDHTDVAGNVINLHIQQDSIWIKTPTEISNFNTKTGAPTQVLTAETLPGIPFARARLVGTAPGLYYLSYDDAVRVVGEDGKREGPYYLQGRRRDRLVESNWKKGVAFIEDNSWTIFVDFKPASTVRIEHERGQLMEVVLSPCSSELLYALQNQGFTEVWHARSNGSRSSLVYKGEKNFSSLEAIWSPESKQIALNILGYQRDAQPGDNFDSQTLLYQPGQGILPLATFFGTEVRALMPTAWDRGGKSIWFTWLHEEVNRPVMYSLFRKN